MRKPENQGDSEPLGHDNVRVKSSRGNRGEAYLNALDAQRIPDPTTAGDFCRRFLRCDVLDLMDAINRTRKRVWAQQPVEFFDQAIIDVDGTLVGTDAEC